MNTKKKTSSFQAKSEDGRVFTVDVWTTMILHRGNSLPGGSEYLLSNGDQLFDVPGTDNQWDIASTDVRITKV